MPDSEPKDSGEGAAGTTILLTEADLRDAARLCRSILDGTPWADLAVSEQGSPPSASSLPLAGEHLTARARALLRARRLRARHFNQALFGEPAWDILLLLYLTEYSEGRQSIGRLAEMVETPLTTVLRWVAYLERERLVSRSEHPTDRRVVFIMLTDKAREAMEAFLNELSE